tara:strand:- start:4764 stop:4922 length:159 start_codon:yes stop_codon:yes gene_type:complete
MNKKVKIVRKRQKRAEKRKKQREKELNASSGRKVKKKRATKRLFSSEKSDIY